MSDESHPSPFSSLLDSDRDGLNAVLAHSMLGTVAAIRGAIDAAMATEVTGPGRDSLLLMAVRRLEFLSNQLRDVAAGVPGSSIVIDVRTLFESNEGEPGAS
jgi:hypothetical protein